MKMGFKENIRFAFIDEFANEIGKEKAYRMMSNFKCERVPALEYFLTRDYNGRKSSPNLCVNSSFSYVVLSTLLLSSRDLTEWSLVYHNTLSYQRFYDLHSIHYDHLEGLHQSVV